jgi:hypothetical protein
MKVCDPMADEADMRLSPSGHPAEKRMPGLDGIAVKSLLGGAVLRGLDPHALLRGAGVDPAVYGSPQAAIDGRDLFRLVRQIQVRSTIPSSAFSWSGSGWRSSWSARLPICTARRSANRSG